MLKSCDFGILFFFSRKALLQKNIESLTQTGQKKSAGTIYSKKIEYIGKRRKRVMETKRVLSIFLCVCMLLTTCIAGTAAFAATEGKLIICQVYGGGGKEDTPISHSFIELYNAGDKEVSLDGVTVEYSYRIRGVRVIDGQKYYTGWSRTVTVAAH